MLLDKEQIWVIFLFKFKMNHKAAETTCNINHAFGLGTANIQCSGGSRSFAKETRTLEMRSAMADHQKLTTTNGEQFLKVILLQLQEKFPRTQHQPFYSFLAFETNWKVGASWANRKSKKIIILRCGLLLFYTTTTNHFSIGLWCVTKSGFYVTDGGDKLSGWTKRKLQSTSQSQTCTKKRSWSLFGGLLPIGSTTAFRIPAKPLHLRSVLSKSMRCIQNCNACSRHWSTERAQFFSITTTPNHISHNQCFKSWMNWSTEICLICHIHLTSHQPTTTSSRILTTFCRENASTTSRMHKMLYKSLSNPKAWIFMLQE